MATFPPEPRPYHKPEYVPSYPDWQGGKCLIIGGGPSLLDMDWDELRRWNHRDHQYTIAVNEACLTVVPHADIAYWVDARWYNWNKERLHLCKALKRYTSAHGQSVDYGGATFVENANEAPFYTNSKYVAGLDSGAIAINLAYHCKASTVYLVGFDMHDTPAKSQGTGNFHDKHQLKQEGCPRSNHFVPRHTKMAEFLPQLAEVKAQGFEVYNCTPHSALKCWPHIPWSRVK